MPEAVGQENGNAKLTDSDVIEIIGKIDYGLNNCEIARLYGVTHQMIWRIRHGKNWTHLSN